MGEVVIAFKEVNIRDYVEAYVSHGWSVIPVGFRSKNPGDLLGKGWQDYDIKKEGIGKSFPQGERRNIGVLLGKKSRGLVDVDLDMKTMAEMRVAEYFLPPTKAVFGHGIGHKRKSHRLYYSRELKSISAYAFGGSKLLELRANGQTILPGSVHKDSGEEIVFADGWSPVILGGVAEVEGTVLKRACSLVAAACVLIGYWKEGVRDDLAVCLNGVLGRADWAPDEVDWFITGIVRGAGDDE